MSRRWNVPLALVAVLAAAGLAGGACSSDSAPDDDLSRFFPPTSEPAEAAGDAESAGGARPERAALLDSSIPPGTALEAVDTFFALIAADRVADAYRLVSLEVRDLITQEQFVQRYQDIWEEATVRAIDYEIVPPPGPNVAGIEVIVQYDTEFFGSFAEHIFAPTRRQPNWTVDWSPDLIFEGLGPRGFLVHRFVDVPPRGDIYDRNGVLLAGSGDVAVIGVSRELIEDEEAVIDLFVQSFAELDERAVRGFIFQDVPETFFIPIVRLPFDTRRDLIARFEQLAGMGILVQRETRRVYPEGALAAHVVGFIGEVTAEELETLAVDGYEPGDLVGVDGAEAILEPELAGRRGGRLTIIDENGVVTREIVARPPEAALDVYLTIDVRIQRLAELALGEKPGAVIVMDPRDGEILAMASFPRYDPNLFVPPRSAEAIAPYLEDEDELFPFVNRPTEQLYPPGSTFKVVTLAAAVEGAGLEPSQRLDCPAVWTGLGEETPLKNWQEFDEGLLTLTQALARSCNTVFYQLALELQRSDDALLPQYSGGFGFGLPTGVVGLDELAGVNPGPEWKRINRNDFWYTGDTVNMSIGQGFLLATPLQITNAYAALATDGILRTPLAVHSLRTADGEIVQRYSATPIGVLPVSAQTLQFLRDATRAVITSGTGRAPFAGSRLAAAGKSGTAEDLGEQTHALFVAYANVPDPRVIVTAVLDEGESGAREAGPIVRDLLERTLFGGLVQ